MGTQSTWGIIEMFAARNSALALLRQNTLRQSTTLVRAVRPQLAVMANMGLARDFSTESISSGATKLNRALEKEIKYENENYTQLEDIETYLNESGFAFSEEDGGVNLSLKKKVGDKNVEIMFEAR